MFDHAAMGTLLIGLDAIQGDTAAKPVRRTVAAPRRTRSIRLVLANGLRRVAAQLQPQTVGELAEET